MGQSLPPSSRQCAAPHLTSDPWVLAEKKVLFCPHSPYYPDLAPCDSWLFPRIKTILKRKLLTPFPTLRGPWPTERLKAFPKKPSRNASNHGINVRISASLAKDSTLKEINSKLYFVRNKIVHRIFWSHLMYILYIHIFRDSDPN